MLLILSYVNWGSGMSIFHKIKVTLGATVLLFATLCTIALFRLDSSMTAVDPYITPEVANAGKFQRPPVVLLSYADGHPTFFKNQFALTQSAADKGFDHIYSFKRSHIDPEFWHKNKDILEQKHGAGYWLWKPYFILQVMKQMPYGSIIVYSDASTVFKKPIGPLLKQLDNYDMVIPIYGNPTPLISQIKKEAYGIFDTSLTTEILNKPATWPFFITIRNTAETQAFVEKWLKACENADAIMNTPLDPKIQAPEFEMHLNDQAILSVLVALEPEKKLLIRRNLLTSDYGIKNFHRHSSREFESPLWLIADMPRLLSEYIWNNHLLVELRRLSH